ncbi:hypothetical protein N9E03_00660 [bacterium]|jgi:hypothetical protein|nr:hypothetical protein [bacterium]
MTKKIRLMDDGTDNAAPTEATESLSNETIDNATVTQLMKFIEAIDWKLWEMLKIMKANDGDPITTKKAEEE